MRGVNQSSHHCRNAAACASDGAAVMLIMAGIAAILCAHQQKALLACGGWPQGSVSLSKGAKISGQLVEFAICGERLWDALNGRVIILRHKRCAIGGPSISIR